MISLYKLIKRRRDEKEHAESQKSQSTELGTTPTARNSPFKETKIDPQKSKVKPCEHQLRASNVASSQTPLTAEHEPKAGSDQIHTSDITEPPTPAPLTKESQTPTISKVAELGEKHCLICKEQKSAARKYRWKLIAGLFFPFALQALDATIIASALPFIASDFHELSQLNWIVSAFNLTSAAFIPAWGQFADIFGRHAAIQTSLVIMIIGSAICAGSPTSAFPLLLFGRALQGIAAAGINILTKVVLADKVSLKENAKNNSIFALVGGISYGVGPAIGGALTGVSWRYCFIINLPVALLGIIMTFFLLRKELLGPQKIEGVDDAVSPLENSTSFGTRLRARLATVDYGGQFLFLFGMGLLIMALTWGGSSYPWTDVRVLAPLVIGILLFSCFIAWEFLMAPGRMLGLRYPLKKAMIPSRLMWSRNAGILCYINFITGMAIFSIFYFIDLFFALVKDYSPGKAGLQLLFYTPGLGVGIYLAMFVCNIWPRQTWWPLFIGTLIEPTGIVLLALALGWDHIATIYGMLALSRRRYWDSLYAWDSTRRRVLPTRHCGHRVDDELGCGRWRSILAHAYVYHFQ